MTSIDNKGSAHTDSIVEALLPNITDVALDDLAATTFIDGGVAVPVTPADQLFMAAARRLGSVGGHGVLLLPRVRNRAALLLAITSHVLRLQPPTPFRGPVVFVGMDLDVSGQLRQLSVQHRRRMGLADGNPLSLHRLTRAGGLDPVVGSVVRPANASMVYLNLRVGVPRLEAAPPLVIIDATSVASPAARTKALTWAAEQSAAAVVVVGDIGDVGLVALVGSMTRREDYAPGVPDPIVLALSDSVIDGLVETFGAGIASTSELSTSPMLSTTRTEIVLEPAGDVEMNSFVTTAFQCIGAKPPGPVPAQLASTLSLLRNGVRLAARVPEYRTACTYNPRPGEMPLLRLLDRDVPRLDGKWAAWQTARLGSLRSAVRSIWSHLESGNPKLLALWTVLDELERTTNGAIVVRCHSRAAADATLLSLSSGDRTPQQVDLWERLAPRVRTTSMKERLSARAARAQVLTAAPPPWLFSLLLGIEAEKTVVLGYDAELRTLQRQGQRWAETTATEQATAYRSLGLAVPAAPTSPVPPLEMPPGSDSSALELPDVSLAAVLDAASEMIDHTEAASSTTAARTATLPGEIGRSCVPVHLDDGRTWWCIDEDAGSTPVVVISAGGPIHRPVKDLRPGDDILVPAGEGTESIHARLVAATRGNGEVQSLDLILSQFRAAARSVLRTAPTQQDAIARVTQAGAEAGGQLVHWANGTTIAPREPSDVAAVFKAADKPCPDLHLIYAVAESLRSLSRHLNSFIAAAASGRADEAVTKLRDLIGPSADELLDEFIIAGVLDVGSSRTVPSGIAGRVR